MFRKSYAKKLTKSFKKINDAITRLNETINHFEQMDGSISLSALAATKRPVYRGANVSEFKIAVANARSVNSKFTDVSNLFHSADASIALLSETWETADMSDKIKSLQEENSLSWHSSPRMGARGGGVAIVVSNKFGHSKKLEFSPPSNDVEVVWCMVSPRSRPSDRIIVASFYSPPPKPGRQVEVGVLQEHIMEVMEICSSKFKSPIFVFGGDINHDSLDDIIALQGFVQAVKEPTRGKNILDVLVTNGDLKDTRIFQPLRPDDELSAASDHRVPLVALRLPVSVRSWMTIKRRLLTSQRQENYAKDLKETCWRVLSGLKSVDEQVQYFHERLSYLADVHFPVRTFRARVGEELWFGQSLRKRWQKMKKIYKKEGNTSRYRAAKSLFRKEKFKTQRQFYSDKIAGLRTSNSRKWYNEIARLARNSGKRETNDQPLVPEFEGLSDQECAEKIADRIESITKNYTLIDYVGLRNKYRPGLEGLDMEDIVKAIANSNIPRGLHDLDPPRLVIKPLARLFAIPLTTIYNKCLREGVWPSLWKIEATSMLPKKKIIESAKDLRPIAITVVFSKILESIIRCWILSDIKDNLHLEQYGGIQGVGTNHYLCSLFHDILSIAETGKVGVLLTFDYSSAFNAMEHTSVVEAAASLGVRPGILALLTDYLCSRKTAVKWGSSTSRLRLNRGGSGQGTLLSVLLFIISVDKLLKGLDKAVDGLESGFVRTRPKLFVDDLAILIPYDPLTFANRGTHREFRDDGRLQMYLDVIEDFSSSTGMMLNKSKTAAIAFNFTKEKIDFETADMCFRNGDRVGIKKEIKLLGFNIDDKMSLDAFVRQRKASATGALWQLRRLRMNGVTKQDLKLVYEQYVRSILEYGMIAAYSSLNQSQMAALESIQRSATRIILGVDYHPNRPSYEDRLSELKLSTLSSRWLGQLGTFSKKVEGEPRFARYLSPNPSTHHMGVRRRAAYLVPRARTERFKSSPICAILRNLNGETA